MFLSSESPRKYGCLHMLSLVELFPFLAVAIASVAYIESTSQALL